MYEIFTAQNLHLEFGIATMPEIQDMLVVLFFSYRGREHTRICTVLMRFVRIYQSVCARLSEFQ
jgi:hypothetical protein